MRAARAFATSRRQPEPGFQRGDIGVVKGGSVFSGRLMVLTGVLRRRCYGDGRKPKENERRRCRGELKTIVHGDVHPELRIGLGSR
jgi:hypothetical protein